MGILAVVSILVPFVVFGQQPALTPTCAPGYVFNPGTNNCQPQGGGGGIVPCSGPDCNFESLLRLARNIIDFLIVVSLPLTGISFIYAGFLYITAGGNEGKNKKNHDIFWKVLWGFVFLLSAWLIVQTILAALLKDAYSFVK